MKRGNARGAEGEAIRAGIDLVNRKREGPNGYGGGRQFLMDGTSRGSGETQARFREGARGAQFALPLPLLLYRRGNGFGDGGAAGNYPA